MKKIFYLFTMFLVFCLLGSLTSASAQSKGPIRIGFLAPLSGGLAQNGKDMLDGFQQCLRIVDHEEVIHSLQKLVHQSPLSG